jgi:catechol 2,3-dioxygenase-like lactoylglutathione lyase family enzyme
MFNHIVVGSNDLARSQRFYDAVLATLGFAGEPVRNTAKSGHERLFYRHGAGTLIVTRPAVDGPASPANGGTIGFRCTSPEQVRAFHDAGVAAGGASIEDPPGERDAGSPGARHLAYLRDPDGNKLCAIWRAEA